MWLTPVFSHGYSVYQIISWLVECRIEDMSLASPSVKSQAISELIDIKADYVTAIWHPEPDHQLFHS